ncbi:MAG: hypothetical protein LIO86_15430 [Lachnospiraceae bacterium]|nr:hypothetical protein [Lachnospiraceae bacterium]
MHKSEVVTASMLRPCGPVVMAVFSRKYPDGLTLGEMKELAQTHGFLRRALVMLEKGESIC